MQEKFRLCTEDKAKKFLDAMHCHKGDVYVRCVDLSSPEEVYAADLYCHVSCFR